MSQREAERIAGQLDRAILGDAWHGPAVLELLDGVDARAASSYPVPGAHSIWELALHITTWLDIPRRRLQGETVEPGESEDWPAIGEPTERRWREAVDALRSAHRAYSAAIRAADEATLDATSPGRTHDNYTLVHGSVQHALYHAGQIAILKRAQAEG
jgi:uncharacterized damage-inducible protein DinB